MEIIIMKTKFEMDSMPNLPAILDTGRTCFVTENGEPVYVIMPYHTFLTLADNIPPYNEGHSTETISE